jgi:DNA uptake protein ComE-like DNA-binding protein
VDGPAPASHETEASVLELEATTERLRRIEQRLELLEEALSRRPPRPAPPAGDQGPLDLNSATFEQLREAGMSVTQAVRVLARRDALGAFHSLDELDEIPGFSSEQRASLKSRARI